MHIPESNPPHTAILPLLNHEQRCTLDELIATGQAVFNLIRFSTLDSCIKDVFYQLEKQFHYYASQATGEGEFDVQG